MEGQRTRNCFNPTCPAGGKADIDLTHPPLRLSLSGFSFVCFVLFFSGCWITPSLVSCPLCLRLARSLRFLFSFFFFVLYLAYSWGPHGPHLCAVGFCFVSVNLFEGRVPGMGYRFLACGFGCNFPNCVVTTSSLPLRLVYVSENNNNNNNPDFFFKVVA